jgi:hypothetical protein
MKIGIITIINVNNYGAELQAFALQYKLRKMGYDAEIINYLYYKNPGFIKENKSKPAVESTIMNKLKDLILKRIDEYSALRYPKIAQTRKKRFNNFHKVNTAISKPYKSYSDLYKSELDYDVYMVGSDQVWNPNNGTNIEPYFLTFAPKEAKTISYASSFGVKEINKSHHSQYKDWLNNIDFLSTRESDGVNIIREISGRDATHVVDPTLLLAKKEWEELLVPYETDEPYILFFVFKKNAFAENLAYEIKKKTGYKIIRVCKNEIPLESDDKILNIRDFGPAEFLGLYQKASFVVTTSFHGSIFSLIFEKPFYTITPSSKNNNSRQHSLMKLVNLEHRLIKEGSEVDLSHFEAIDFVSVGKLMKNEIDKSEKYITSSLKY